MKRNGLFISIIIFAESLLYAQKFTISGYVRDASNGESLIGANVWLDELKKGATSNTYGFYSITIEKGTYTLVAKYLGYTEFKKKIVVDKNIQLNIELTPTSIVAKEVVITDNKAIKNIESTEMGKIDIPVQTIKQIPVVFGEADIMKTLQLMPGIQTAGEGNTDLYVRGGGPDQNLILLDEAIVYNPSHLFGFFSTFNADAIQNIEMFKSGMPAYYGGRLASVLDVTMKEGNMKQWQADGGIGLIASRISIQGPLKKDTASFIVSARRTYADLLIKPFTKSNSIARATSYYFYDINIKTNYRISQKDRLFLSTYFGQDLFDFNFASDQMKTKINWGNWTTTFRWNHLYNPKLFSNFSFIFSQYHFTFDAKQELIKLKLYSGIQDITSKLDYTYLASFGHNLKFGLFYSHHCYTPNNASGYTGETELDLGKTVRLYSHEMSLYVNDEFSISNRLKLNLGIRGTDFMHTGPFDRYVHEDFNLPITDTIHYSSRDIVKNYFHLEPRVSLRFSIDTLSSIKASYTQNYQYVHLVSTSTTTLPTDVWVPSTDKIKPQLGIQYSLGYYRNFFDNTVETSIEGYYKTMKNQLEYAEGVLLENTLYDNIDNYLVFGKGTSYGVEFLIQKRMGSTTGWIGYTWSKTTRHFPLINNGEPFPAKYDRRHDISFVINHAINESLTISIVWVYATGNTTTMPVSRYIIDGNVVSEYGPRNGFRLPPYHRADVSVNWIPKPKKKRRFEQSWNFSIYNLYNRKNPYFIFIDVDGDILTGNAIIKAKQVSLFPILPSITWNFKF